MTHPCPNRRTSESTQRTLGDKPALGAELARVAVHRWSLVEKELELGLRSLAVPVRDRSGATVAALNVATFSAAHSAEYLIDRYLPDLRAAAGQLERAI